MHDLCSGPGDEITKNLDFKGKFVFKADCITCIFNINYTNN